MGRYSLGVDFGTGSCRAVLVDLESAEEVADAVYAYPSGRDGVITSEADPDLARQEPADYLAALESVFSEVLSAAAVTVRGFDACDVVGVAVATTGSTPLPIDRDGLALALHPDFRGDLAAKAWLWKDHTAHAEAAAITETARDLRPEYVAACGGTYSAEWFWAKIWHCLRTAPRVFEAAQSWVELCDYLVGELTGKRRPEELPRGVTAAGHKAMYAARWGGLPDVAFLTALDPRLAELRDRLYDVALPAPTQAGTVSDEWARRTGLAAGTPVAFGTFDSHAAALSAGARTGVLVKVMGTSTVDITVVPPGEDGTLPDMPGISGVVAGSVVPGLIGVEAGQSAVGDAFAWVAEAFADDLQGRSNKERLAALAEAAGRMRPGEHGLLALDWFNGNRSVLVDQRLSGVIVGLTLQSRAEEVYQAVVEATAFGARRIVDQIESEGRPIEKIVACGGLPWHNPQILQTYADVLGRPVYVARSRQSSAHGAALIAAVAGEAFGSVEEAQDRLTGFRDDEFAPDPAAVAIYDRLYRLYLLAHDAFGGVGGHPLGVVMKDLLNLRDAARVVTTEEIS